jgi:hypothetical protein
VTPAVHAGQRQDLGGEVHPMDGTCVQYDFNATTPRRDESIVQR